MKICVLYLFLLGFVSLIAGAMDPVYTETKSILTDGDWKKLWMEAGNSNANLKKDNTIDSSDSPIFDDTEVSQASINYINNLAKPILNAAKCDEFDVKFIDRINQAIHFNSSFSTYFHCIFVIKTYEMGGWWRKIVLA